MGPVTIGVELIHMVLIVKCKIRTRGTAADLLNI